MAKFNDDGTTAHVRGDLQAVVKAILLDSEARSVSAQTSASGKLREPSRESRDRYVRFCFHRRAAASVRPATRPSRSRPPHRTVAPPATKSGSISPAAPPATLPWNMPLNTFYTVTSTPAPTTYTFCVSAAEVTTGTYTQAAGSTTLAVTVATQPSNTYGPMAGGQVYLKFLTGGGTDGIFTLATVIDKTHYTVTTASAPSSALSGYYITKTTPSFQVGVESQDYLAAYNLRAGDVVWMTIIPYAGAQFVGQQLTVRSIVNSYLFNVNWSGATLRSDYLPNTAFYPLIPSVLSRSGSVALPSSKYDMTFTDSQLARTPFHAPTVFNFFYPDYKFPGGNGTLAANNVTTPEFQLTTDTCIVTLSNQITSMMLDSADTNGQCNFDNGAIYFTFAPYMTSPYSVADSTGVTNLVNKLSDLLTGGQMSAASKTAIVNYVNNTTSFPTSSSTNVRDRVRAILLMILLSSKYAVQR